MTKKTVTLEFTNVKRLKCTAKVDMPAYGIIAGQRFHLVHLHGNEYAVKAITVTNRNNYKNGDVRFEIVNNDGTPYVTTLRRNAPHSCSCPSSKKCYHILILADTENARLARIRAEKMARQAIVVAPIIDNPSMSANTSTLTGSNEFHLLKPTLPQRPTVHA